MSYSEPQMLAQRDIGKILGIARGTVSQYRRWSKGTGRYAQHPFPEPDGFIGRSPYWAKERLTEIRTWATSRPGQGAGGGTPAHKH